MMKETAWLYPLKILEFLGAPWIGITPDDVMAFCRSSWAGSQGPDFRHDLAGKQDSLVTDGQTGEHQGCCRPSIASMESIVGACRGKETASRKWAGGQADRVLAWPHSQVVSKIGVEPPDASAGHAYPAQMSIRRKSIFRVL